MSRTRVIISMTPYWLALGGYFAAVIGAFLAVTKGWWMVLLIGLGVSVIGSVWLAWLNARLRRASDKQAPNAANMEDLDHG